MVLKHVCTVINLCAEIILSATPHHHRIEPSALVVPPVKVADASDALLDAAIMAASDLLEVELTASVYFAEPFSSRQTWVAILTLTITLAEPFSSRQT